MSKYNYNDSPAPKKQSSRLELWDMLSILVLLATLCIGAYFVAVFLFPNSALNPFPPHSSDPSAPPTPTITPIQLQPTWTVTLANVTETSTLLPTFTLEPSALNQWVARLSASPLMSSLRLAQVKIENTSQKAAAADKPSAGGAPTWSFSLVSAEPPPRPPANASSAAVSGGKP